MSKKKTKLDKKKSFENKIREIYGESSEEILSCHYQVNPKTFRVNALLATDDVVLQSLKNEGYIIQESELPHAYVCRNDSSDLRLSDSKCYQSHHIYIQELSSMLPTIVLLADIASSNISQSLKILDLCAAPGSKTTQLAAMTENMCEIIAVEKSRGRYFTLKKLLSDFGCSNVRTIQEDANRIVNRFPQYENYFDYVLVDVPCTNEGGINLLDSKSLETWHEREPKRIAKLQRGILNSGLKMLKPGGTLIYSTCTYSVEENEAVVYWTLNKWGEQINISGIKIPISNIQSGRVEWNGKKFDKDLEKTIRVLPNELYNGFFLAKLKKL